MPADVQDALVTVLSEKTLPVPELDTEVAGRARLQPHRHRQRPRPWRQRAVERPAAAVQHGRAAAAGDRRRGDRHRQPPRRRARRGAGAARRAGRRRRDPPRRHRSSASCAAASPTDGRTSLKVPSGTLSTAEAISVVTNGLALAAHFGDGTLAPADVAAGIVGAVVSDPVHDARRLARVPRGRGPRPRRLGRLLRRLPRPRRVSAGRDDRRRRSRCTCSASGTTVPGRPASVVRALDALQPGDGARRAAGRPRGGAAVDRRRRSRAAGGAARLRGRPTRRGRRSRRSPSSAPSGRRSLGQRARRAGAGDRPAARRHVRRRRPSDDELVGQRDATRSARRLAAAAGDPDPERWWDDVIEHRGDGPPAFDAVAEAMAAVARRLRADAAAKRSARRTCARRSAPRVAAIGTARSPSSAGPGTCPRSTSLGARRRPTDAATLRGLPEGEGRLRLGAVDAPPAGTGSGLRRRRASPGWYRHVFRHPGPPGSAASSSSRRGCCAAPGWRRRPTT